MILFPDRFPSTASLPPEDSALPSDHTDIQKNPIPLPANRRHLKNAAIPYPTRYHPLRWQLSHQIFKGFLSLISQAIMVANANNAIDSVSIHSPTLPKVAENTAIISAVPVKSSPCASLCPSMPLDAMASPVRESDHNGIDKNSRHADIALTHRIRCICTSRADTGCSKSRFVGKYTTGDTIAHSLPAGTGSAVSYRA